MRDADRVTIKDRGIPGLVLMENAGARVYELLTHRCSPLRKECVLVLCGKGNNGGDGLVVARLIATREPQARLDVVLFADPAELTGDAAANYRMLRGVDVEPLTVTSPKAWKGAKHKLSAATIVVDALLGTGLQGPARGLLAEVIHDVNAECGRARVVAVDMPSGMPSDSGEPTGEAVRADYTVTFTAPKISQVFPPNCEHVGELTVAPIGTARSVLESNPKLKLLLLEGSDFTSLLAPRSPSSHKGDFGHVLVVGGSRSKPGAVIRTGDATLRAGAGLVTVATAAGAVGAVVSHTPELMTIPADEMPDGSMAERSFSADWLERKTIVAIGPGVGTASQNAKLVLRVAEEAWKAKLPLVVDADGLTALASAKKWKRPASVTVLTPHPGEMSRLTGLPVKEVLQRRVEVAREFAEKRGVYLVLKGFRTLIASPDGQVLVNPTGTPAMAKGGSGDVLTGMIAGFLAQFPKAGPALVIAAAVYLHGLAAQMAAKSEQTLLATDILSALPQAHSSLRG